MRPRTTAKSALDKEADIRAPPGEEGLGAAVSVEPVDTAVLVSVEEPEAAVSVGVGVGAGAVAVPELAVLSLNICSHFRYDKRTSTFSYVEAGPPGVPGAVDAADTEESETVLEAPSTVILISETASLDD